MAKRPHWFKCVEEYVANNAGAPTKQQVEAVLTGEISSHSHAGGSGDLVSTNNLSDIANTATALSNLGGEPANANIQTHVGSAHAPSNADNTSENETSHADVLVDGDIGVSVASQSHNHTGVYEPLKGADDNYVTDAEKTVIGNTSGTNTGDQVIPTDLADLAEDPTHRIVTDAEKSTWNGKQDGLVSGTNIKTVNSTSLLGSGDLEVSASFTMNIIELTQQTMQQHDSTADLVIQWKQQDTTNANFTHSTSTNPHQITCVNAGWLDVRYSVFYDQDDTARLNTEAYVTLNGTRVQKSTSRKTYYRGLSYGKWGDESKAFYLYVTAGQIIEVHSGVADGNTGFTLTRAIDTVPDITNIQIRFLG